PSTLESGWAPEGQGVVWLSTFVPWTPEQGQWDQALLEEASELTWKTAEKALGWEMTPVEKKMTGPLEWVERHGNPGANPNHIEMSIDQLMAMRPSVNLSGYSTPIEGLFLTGAGTHPGGGITGMPGRNAAGVILEELGLSKRRPGAKLKAQAAMMKDALRATRELRKNA
ncbi:MAG: NAD(P)/FAD-dependent oxidoreductase, partial [Solirubrobacterales bacterium]|nr:NAD(P)/FAD-dependent oxidoreductase [Solirubrobacterales bacterium]